MRANEFITEAKMIDPDSWAMLSANQIKTIAQQAFSTVYPGVRLYASENDFVYISTSKSPAIATQWGEKDDSDWDPKTGEQKNHYYMALNVATYADSEISVVVGNATAGDFKGVTAKIIQALFTKAIAAWGAPTKCVLIISDDASDGAWERIASQLGAEYVEQ